MWSLLLNPRVWVAAILIGLVGWVCLHIDDLEDTVAERDIAIVTLKADLEKCQTASALKQVALDGCAQNIESIRASNDELQAALEQSRVYRKKWKEVTAEQAELPPPKDDEQCLNGGKIDEGHKAILRAALDDLANYYSLRRKIKHPDAAAGDSAGPAKVLPQAAGVAR